MRHLIRIKGGAEADCFTGWRHVLCYMCRPGVKKKIKRKYKKRERKWLKTQLKGEIMGG